EHVWLGGEYRTAWRYADLINVDSLHRPELGIPLDGIPLVIGAGAGDVGDGDWAREVVQQRDIPPCRRHGIAQVTYLGLWFSNRRTLGPGTHTEAGTRQHKGADQ